jgi:hypothetical protein
MAEDIICMKIHITCQRLILRHSFVAGQQPFEIWGRGFDSRSGHRDWFDRAMQGSSRIPPYYCMVYKRAVWEVRGLTLSLRVETLPRCCDGLFFKAPPWASDALLTTLQSLLENVLQTVCRKLQAVLTFHVRLSVPKALPPLVNRSSSPWAWWMSCRFSKFNRATLTLH